MEAQFVLQKMPVTVLYWKHGSLKGVLQQYEGYLQTICAEDPRMQDVLSSYRLTKYEYSVVNVNSQKGPRLSSKNITTISWMETSWKTNFKARLSLCSIRISECKHLVQHIGPWLHLTNEEFKTFGTGKPRFQNIGWMRHDAIKQVPTLSGFFNKFRRHHAQQKIESPRKARPCAQRQ